MATLALCNVTFAAEQNPTNRDKIIDNTQQSVAKQSPTTKSFYTLKAKEYLSNVALQEVYKKGQECALKVLRILAIN